MRLRLRRSIMRSQLLVKIAAAGLVTVVVGTLALVGLFAYYAKDLPSPDRVVRRDGFATKIYDRNGELLYDVFEGERRTPVEFDQIPLVLRQATIAIEDKNFYNHSGFDVWGMARGIFRTLFLGRTQGGSTITQQLVKNVLLTQQQTVTRKLKEFILTVQVERRYSKDEILRMYLNESPYGGAAYGVQTAAETYFGKPVSEVNLAEAAILAGLPQSPSRYSPSAGDLYISRAKDVLRRMREDGYISREEELQAGKDIDGLAITEPSGLLKAPHFVFYVRELLEERYGPELVEQGGLRVTTTLDLELQEEAQLAVSEEIAKVENLKITNGGAVMVDSTNGQILAMVGSKDWSDPNYDGKFNVTTALRQPGSSIKPVVYLAGLQKGYTAATLFMDTETSFPGGDQPEYIPKNYDGKFRGPILMREALGNSINVPAVKMLALVGIQDTMQLAYNMGLSTLEPTKDNLARVGLSVALGGGEVRLLEMASAYSAFANGGKKVDPVAILKVTDKDGRVLEEWKQTQPKQVISPAEAFIISSILSDPKAREITFGSRSALNIAGQQIAVKTGTTNDRRDNWTVGWTAGGPVIGVWVGNNDNSPMTSVASGVTGASPIWRRITLAAINKLGSNPFVPPDGVVSLEVDALSGYPAHDSFAAKQEYFIRGTEPSGPDPVHQLVQLCNGEKKEYYFFKEEDPFASGGRNRWQEGVLNWLNTQADEKYHPPADLCSSQDQVNLSIAEPSDHAQIDTNDVKIRVDVSSKNKIEKVEFRVNGELKDTVTSATWQTTINLPTGTHHIEAKARDSAGREASRSIVIGVKQPWDASPTPTPTP